MRSPSDGAATEFYYCVPVSCIINIVDEGMFLISSCCKYHNYDAWHDCFFLFCFFNIFLCFFSLTVSEVETVDVFSEHSIFENYFLYFSRVFSLAVGPGKDQFAWVCMLTQRKFESCSAAPPAPCSMHRVVVTLLRMRPRPTTRHEPFCRSRSTSTCRFL